MKIQMLMAMTHHQHLKVTPIAVTAMIARIAMHVDAIATAIATVIVDLAKSANQ